MFKNGEYTKTLMTHSISNELKNIHQVLGVEPLLQM